MSYIPNVFFIVPVGVIAGVLLAMPIGPVNLLGLQRAVERGFFGGLAAGLGIVLSDGLLALLAALGVNAVSGAIRQYRAAIQTLGGVALVGAGVRLCLTPGNLSTLVEPQKARLRDYARDIWTMFFLNISNPGSVLALLAMYAGVCSFLHVESTLDAITVAVAFMGGGFLYWFWVSEWIASARHRLDKVQIGQINRIAGLVLVGFGGLLMVDMALRWTGWR